MLKTAIPSLLTQAPKRGQRRRENDRPSMGGRMRSSVIGAAYNGRREMARGPRSGPAGDASGEGRNHDDRRTIGNPLTKTGGNTGLARRREAAQQVAVGSRGSGRHRPLNLRGALEREEPDLEVILGCERALQWRLREPRFPHCRVSRLGILAGRSRRGLPRQSSESISRERKKGEEEWLSVRKRGI